VESIDKINIKIQHVTGNYLDVPLPEYSTSGSSGMDVRAAIDDEMIIEKGKVVLVPTNLRAEIPTGYELQVRPRSGLAAKNGIGVLNSPGTIDSDYRGEIKIILFNFGEDNFVIKRGDRIAQLVLSKVYNANLILSDDLNESRRGSGGFGHTGKD
jgi:dUTP pyrophosphatase